MNQTKVHAIGIQIKLAQNMSMKDFYQGLLDHADRDIRINPTTHVVYASNKQNYIVGLILTYRNHRKYLEAKRDAAGQLAVDKLEVAAGAHGTEVSTFVLNPGNGRGVIYTYYGSLSAGRTALLFRRIHKSVKDKLIAERVAASGAVTEAEMRKAMGSAYKHFNGLLELEVLVTESDLNSLLDKYQKIERVEVSAVQGLIDAPLLTPLAAVANTSSYGVSISAKAGLQAVIGGVKAALGQLDPEEQTLRIIGKALNGEELSQCVGRNREDFEKLNYDDFVTELPDDFWRNFDQSPSITRGIAIMKKYLATFGKPPAQNWP